MSQPLSRAFGLGPLPGIRITEALDVITTETPSVVHLPQLPARGVGADAVGSTTALFDGLHAEVGPRGWVLSPRPQQATRLARDLIQRDLDACEEVWGSRPETVKIQAMGPWSLAASVELPGGYLAITDPGALRDLTEALIAAVNNLREECARRFDASIIVQLDEPLLSDINSGDIPGPTRLDPVRAVHEKDLTERLHTVASGIRATQVEVLLNLTSSGRFPLLAVARESGVDGVLFNTNTLRTGGSAALDSLAETFSTAMRMGLGGNIVDPEKRLEDFARLMDLLTLDPALLAAQVDIHPAGPSTPASALVDAAKQYQRAEETAHLLRTRGGDL